MTITDDDDKTKTITIPGVISGNGSSTNNSSKQDKKDEGPIPGGTYYLDTGSDSSDMGWRYKIFVPKKGGGWTYGDDPEIPVGNKKIHRGGFNLHAGRYSDGCVTVKSDIEPNQPGYPGGTLWDKVRKIIDKTKPIDIIGKNGKPVGKASGKIIVQ